MKKKKIWSLILIMSMLMTMVLPAGVPVYADATTFKPTSWGDAINGSMVTWTLKEGDVLDLTDVALPIDAAGKAIIINSNNAKIIGLSGKKFEKLSIEISGGANLIVENLMIDNISGNAGKSPIIAADNNAANTLLLSGTNWVKAGMFNAGIHVGAGKALIISGALVDSLTAIGSDIGAGIGGSSNGGSIIGEAGGQITINGGTLIASSDNGGAGIGGCGGSGPTGVGGASGNITINGGHITATGGNGGAGIGGAGGTNGGGAGETIVISLATVVATGGYGGSGIGGGGGINAGGAGGNITLNSGAITATGGGESSGIGGGGSNVSVGAGSTLNVTAGAIVKAVSTTNTLPMQPAISTIGGTIGSKILMANYAALIVTNTETQVLVKGEATSTANLVPTIGYESIAFTVSNNGTYQIKTNGLYQKHNVGPSSDFVINSNGITVFNGLVDGEGANILSVEQVKDLVDNAVYTMMQSPATTEAAIKAAIEAKMATLDLDGVTPVVTKVLYTPAVAGLAGTPAGTNGTYTFTVNLSKGTVTDTTATLTMTVTATNYVEPSIEEDSPTLPVIQKIKGAEILVNGEVVSAGTTVDTKVDGKMVTIVTLDAQKIDQMLTTVGNNAKVTISTKTDSDVQRGQLNGQMVKNMENKQAVLEIIANSATYTLPAKQIDIDAISKQMGNNVALEEIKVTIEISKTTEASNKRVENAAKEGKFDVIVPSVEFNISCTYADKTIDVSYFNAYVERTIAIPVGVDPMKITTGILVDAEGVVRHVPTKITIVDGKYFAKINSLTNSIYSLIWNPIEFKDSENHWAKEAINDLGSRLIVSGNKDALYEPDRDITRAEFAAIVVKALGLKPGTGKSSFSDIKTTAWTSGYVETAFEMGLIYGYDKERFGPDTKITREQATAIIANAMKITGLQVDLINSESERILSVFGDASLAAPWSVASIASCVKTGIVTGKSASHLAPKDTITRAEVAVMIRKLLQKSNLI